MTITDNVARPMVDAPTRHRERVSRIIPATPDAIFGLICDPNRLTEWNAAITEVVDAPTHLAIGSVWRVRFRVFGMTWVSRSEVTELEPASGRFGYRSQTDDGNPSYAEWQWHVRRLDLCENGNRSVVSAGVDLHPRTFGRTHLMVKIRRPMLRREMRHSLMTLGEAAGV